MKQKKLFLLAGIFILSVSANAQVALDSIGRDAKYVENIMGRSQKIVNALQPDTCPKTKCCVPLTDEVKKNVLHIICNRYFLLDDIYTKNGKNKQAINAELYTHHFEFAAALANYISPKQIEQVKDGMTYGVVPKTYQAHLEMIPSLKEEEKLQILNWLKEAREFAIDAETSKAKHGWFGKYKGRINNWLAKRGYDLTAEREAWYKRIEAKKKK